MHRAPCTSGFNGVNHGATAHEARREPPWLVSFARRIMASLSERTAGTGDIVVQDILLYHRTPSLSSSSSSSSTTPSSPPLLSYCSNEGGSAAMRAAIQGVDGSARVVCVGPRGVSSDGVDGTDGAGGASPLFGVGTELEREAVEHVMVSSAEEYFIVAEEENCCEESDGEGRGGGSCEGGGNRLGSPCSVIESLVGLQRSRRGRLKPLTVAC